MVKITRGTMNPRRVEQDPVSTMQKTSLTNYFIVIPGLKKGIIHGCDHYWAVNRHFSVYLDIFGMVTNERTNNQPTG